MSRVADPADYEFAKVTMLPRVVNRWLVGLIAVLVLALGVVAGALVQTQLQVRNILPVVVREHLDGTLEVQRYSAASYQASENTAKWLLERAATLHWRRVRTEVSREYKESLAFLSPEVIKQEQSSPTGEKDVLDFLEKSRRDDVDVADVKAVIIERQFDANQRLSGGRALIKFVEETKAVRTRDVTESVARLVQVSFTLPPQIENDILSANPIGLQITSLTLQ